MKKKIFYALKNKDAADEYVNALLAAGYEESEKMNHADFILIDHEHSGNKRDAIEKFIKIRPAFIYPHVPYSWWAWDGNRSPLPVCCNFVTGQAAIQGMKSYGYPYRVEAVGFTGCPVREFTPSTGSRLLFAPPHLLGNGKYAWPQILDSVKKIAVFIVENIKAFDSVTVNYSYQGLEAGGLDCFEGVEGVSFEEINAYRTPNIRKSALRQIEKVDMVISTNTLAYLAVASGKPTIFFMLDFLVDRVKNYHLYKSYYDFPLAVEGMTIEDILSTRLSPNPKVEEWKALNIGHFFDKEKFLEIIKEYV